MMIYEVRRVQNERLHTHAAAVLYYELRLEEEYRNLCITCKLLRAYGGCLGVKRR
jgi:hypothetical protein